MSGENNSCAAFADVAAGLALGVGVAVRGPRTRDDGGFEPFPVPASAGVATQPAGLCPASPGSPCPRQTWQVSLKLGPALDRLLHRWCSVLAPF